MSSLSSITSCAFIAIIGSSALAQEAIHIDDDYVLPSILFDDRAAEYNDIPSMIDPITAYELSEYRAAGMDPSWMSTEYQLPRFDGHSFQRLTQGDHPLSIESWATHHTQGQGIQVHDSVNFRVGRTTELRDGNISGSEGTLNTTSVRDHVSSIAQSEGEYEVYDLALEWDAINAGPVTISLLSGLKAIEANIGKRVTVNNDTTIEQVNRFTAMPMIGSGVHWQVNDRVSFSGAAITVPIETGDTLVDFNASTDLRISKNVDLSAGYRILRSSFEVGSVNTDVTQEGLFARLQIKF